MACIYFNLFKIIIFCTYEYVLYYLYIIIYIYDDDDDDDDKVY